MNKEKKTNDELLIELLVEVRDLQVDIKKRQTEILGHTIEMKKKQFRILEEIQTNKLLMLNEGLNSEYLS